MVTFSVDQLHGAVVLSVCRRYEKLPWFRPLPDPWLMFSYHSPPQDDLTIIMGGVANLDLYRLWEAYNSIGHVVKASGVILLLGVGSLVCYRLYTSYRRKSSTSSPQHSPKSPKVKRKASSPIRDLLDDSCDDDFSDIHAQYFGPDGDLNISSIPVSDEDAWSNNGTSGVIGDEEDTSDSPSLVSGCSSEEWGRSRHQVRRRVIRNKRTKRSHRNMGNHQCHLEPVHYNPREGVSFMAFTDEKPPTQEYIRRSQEPTVKGCHSKLSLRVPLNNSRGNSPVTPRRKTKKILEKYRGVYPGTPSEEQPPRVNNVVYPRGAPEQKPVSFRQSHRGGCRHKEGHLYLPNCDRLPPDGLSSRENSISPGSTPLQEQEQLQALLRSPKFRMLLEAKYGENYRLHREGSVDSTASEISLDIAVQEELGKATTEHIDQILNEISEVKMSCEGLDDELGTLRTENCAQDVRELLKTTFSSYSVGSCAGDSVTSSPIAAASSTPDSMGNRNSDYDPNNGSPFYTESSSRVGSSHQNLLLNEASRKLLSGVSTKVPSVVGRHLETPSDSPASDSFPRDDSYVSLEWDDQGYQMYPEESELIQGCLSKNVLLPDHLKSLEMNMDMELRRESHDLGSLSQDSESAFHSRSGSHSPRRDHGSQLSRSKHTWSSEESGYMEGSCHGLPSGDASPMSASVKGGLSPVHEKKEPVPQSTSSAHTTEVKRRKSGVGKGNRDSAYSDGGWDIAADRSAQNIGARLDVVEYGEQEWKGGTERASTLRKGYQEIPSRFSMSRMRRIRGDNYCGVRSFLLQYLIHGQPLNTIREIFPVLKSIPYILDWNFANRLPYSREDALQGVENCLSRLDFVTQEIARFKTDQREEMAVNIFNSESDTDVELMEAVKLVMLAAAVRLKDKEECCLLSAILFSRESSPTPKSLVKNHLNSIGDTGGIGHLEFSLLGVALESKIIIIKPGSYGLDDYHANFPSEQFGYELPPSSPHLHLLAEDDRHYSVLLK